MKTNITSISRKFMGMIPSLLGLTLIASCGDHLTSAEYSGKDYGSSAEFIAAYCDLWKPCCQMAGLATDGRACRVWANLAAQEGSYDVEAGKACLSELRAGVSSAKICSDLQNEQPACDAVFGAPPKGAAAKATKNPGEPCSDDSECIPSTQGQVECHIEWVQGSETNKCKVAIRGKEGDQPCVGTVEVTVDGTTTHYADTESERPTMGFLCHISDGLTCDMEACRKLRAVGEACYDDWIGECISTAYCDTDEEKCVERKPIGAACDASPFGSSRSCVDGAYCREGDNQCAEKLAAGAACEDSEECQSNRCVNLLCEPVQAPFEILGLFCGGT